MGVPRRLSCDDVEGFHVPCLVMAVFHGDFRRLESRSVLRAAADMYGLLVSDMRTVQSCL